MPIQMSSLVLCDLCSVWNKWDCVFNQSFTLILSIFMFQIQFFWILCMFLFVMMMKYIYLVAFIVKLIEAVDVTNPIFWERSFSLNISNPNSYGALIQSTSYIVASQDFQGLNTLSDYKTTPEVKRACLCLFLVLTFSFVLESGVQLWRILHVFKFNISKITVHESQ